METSLPPCWIDPPDGPPQRIIVEGLIGAGKTSLSKALSVLTGYHLMEEPVEDNELLPLFYEDPERWGFAMQVKMLTSRLAMEKAATYMVQAGLVQGAIADRSLGGDTVFLEVNSIIGNICPQERDLYLNLYEQMKITCPYPDVVLYLRVSPDVIRERIRDRGREFELPLTEMENNYLELLEEAYSRFCSAMTRHTTVVMLDWDEFLPVEDVWWQVLEQWDQENQNRHQKRLMRW